MPLNPGGGESTAELPALLAAAAAGDRAAFDRAFALLYDELGGLARAQRGRWRGNETLSTTVLVHEAYLRLAGGARWENRRHFFALAAQVMRQILVNYAEAQRAAKRGGEAERVPLEHVEGAATGRPPEGIGEDGDGEEILALHEALGRLAAEQPRQAKIVECRFFAGLSIPETAEALDISQATVKREWSVASAWLYRAIAGAGPGGATG
jgi:RNA polymerase sigma factor (TIGR02999 family)